MKVYSEYKIKELSPALQSLLNEYRDERSFSPSKIARQKIERLNDYFSESGLNTAVVAVSGGADSALVLALLVAASRVEGGPIKHVVPVSLPALDSVGATGQDASLARASELCESFGVDLRVLDIADFVENVTSSVEAVAGVPGGGWSKGQMVAYMRTPILYYFTTLFTDIGQKAVLVGTTNADEGQYIGYIGKASDAMVDIQLISDLHKSEVYALSSYLGVPSSIINAVPTGDMYDGRVDEEVFGFPYGFIELYINYLRLNSEQRDVFIGKLQGSGEADIFTNLSKNVEEMHRYNKHKYLGCSPSVHLDVLNTRVPKGGWKYYVFGE